VAAPAYAGCSVRVHQTGVGTNVMKYSVLLGIAVYLLALVVIIIIAETTKSGWH